MAATQQTQAVRGAVACDSRGVPWASARDAEHAQPVAHGASAAAGGRRARAPRLRERDESDSQLPDADQGRRRTRTCAASAADASGGWLAGVSPAASAAGASDDTAADGQRAGQVGLETLDQDELDQDETLDQDEHGRLCGLPARAPAEPLVVETARDWARSPCHPPRDDDGGNVARAHEHWRVSRPSMQPVREERTQDAAAALEVTRQTHDGAAAEAGLGEARATDMRGDDARVGVAPAAMPPGPAQGALEGRASAPASAPVPTAPMVTALCVAGKACSVSEKAQEDAGAGGKATQGVETRHEHSPPGLEPLLLAGGALRDQTLVAGVMPTCLKQSGGAVDALWVDHVLQTQTSIQGGQDKTHMHEQGTLTHVHEQGRQRAMASRVACQSRPADQGRVYEQVEEQPDDKEEEERHDEVLGPVVPWRCNAAQGDAGPRETQNETRRCTMQSLIDAGLVRAGRKVLRVMRNGRALFGDLLSDSLIRYSHDNLPRRQGLTFQSPSGFANHCGRMLDSKFKYGNGFTMVWYSADGQAWEPLDNCRQQWALLQLRAEKEANQSSAARSSCTRGKRWPVNRVKASSLVHAASMASLVHANEAASSARLASELQPGQGARKRARRARPERCSQRVCGGMPGMSAVKDDDVKDDDAVKDDDDDARDVSAQEDLVGACENGGEGSSDDLEASMPASHNQDFHQDNTAILTPLAEHGGEAAEADTASGHFDQDDSLEMQMAHGDQDKEGAAHGSACAARGSEDTRQEDMGQEWGGALALPSRVLGVNSRRGGDCMPAWHADAITRSATTEPLAATTRRQEVMQTQRTNALHSAYSAGDFVEARFMGRKNTWYPADVVEKARAGVSYAGMGGSVAGVNIGSVYLVRYHNKAYGQRLVNRADMRACQDFDWLRPLAMQFSGQPLHLVHMFAEGDRVEARFRHEQGNKCWFSGRIALARGNGTYKIDYDDGDSEAAVRCENIRLLGPRAGGNGSAAALGGSLASGSLDYPASPSNRLHHPPVDAWGWRKKKIARVAAAAQLPEEGSKDEDVTWHFSAEGVCDGIAALKRQGVASHVHESSRICYKWSAGEWYMGTVQKRCSCVCSCVFVNAVAIFGCVEAFPDCFCLWV